MKEFRKIVSEIQTTTLMSNHIKNDAKQKKKFMKKDAEQKNDDEERRKA